MKRRDAALALASASLAPLAWAQGGPVEGKHYVRLPTPLPATPGRIEVIEFFLYTCPHCYAFDPMLEAWAHQQPADVSLRRIPVGAHAMQKMHRRVFHALEAMGAMSPAVHAGIFNAVQRGGVEVTDEASAVELAGKLGVDTAKFKQAFNSFGVQSKVPQAIKLADDCGVKTVPTLIVAGRWRTGLGSSGAPGEAGEGQHALAVADLLIKTARSGKVS